MRLSSRTAPDVSRSSAKTSAMSPPLARAAPSTRSKVCGSMSGASAWVRTDTGGIVTVVPRSASDAPALSLPAGLHGSITLTVSDADTALALGSGDVSVLGTPRLVALCEEASCQAIAGRLLPGQTSVASRLQFDHLAPVGVGASVVAEATLDRVEGRRLVFTITASLRSDAYPGLIGAGRLTRVLVDREKFLTRANCAAGD